GALCDRQFRFDAGIERDRVISGRRLLLSVRELREIRVRTGGGRGFNLSSERHERHVSEDWAAGPAQVRETETANRCVGKEVTAALVLAERFFSIRAPLNHPEWQRRAGKGVAASVSAQVIRQWRIRCPDKWVDVMYGVNARLWRRAESVASLRGR